MTEIGPLRYLAQAYFHNDWFLEFDTPAAAFSEYVATIGRDRNSQLLAELDGIIKAVGRDDAALQLAWENVGGYEVGPPDFGMSYSQWFEFMRDTVARHLA